MGTEGIGAFLVMLLRMFVEISLRIVVFLLGATRISMIAPLCVRDIKRNASMDVLRHVLDDRRSFLFPASALDSGHLNPHPIGCFLNLESAAQ